MQLLAAGKTLVYSWTNLLGPVILSISEALIPWKPFVLLRKCGFGFEFSHSETHSPPSLRRQAGFASSPHLDALSFRAREPLGVSCPSALLETFSYSRTGHEGQVDIMSSGILTSIYRQYKQDTTYVTSYLAVTAKSRGYKLENAAEKGSKSSTPTSGPVLSSEKPQRLKGKARKLAKQAAEQKADPPATKANAAQRIPVDTFVHLAAFIANLHSPSVEVPKSFVACLDRAIEFRTEFSSFLKRTDAATSEDQQQNLTHAYFVDILRKVEEILKPRVATSVVEEDDLSELFVNRFRGLDVHEPSDDFLRAPDVHTKGSEQHDTRNQNFATEKMLAYFCLLREILPLRLEVVRRWSDYKDGKGDLAVASLAADAAVSLARSLEDDIPEGLRQSDDIAWFLWGFTEDNAQEEVDDAAPGFEDFSLLRPSHILHSIRASIARNPHSKPASFTYDPSSASQASLKLDEFQLPQCSPLGEWATSRLHYIVDFYFLPMALSPGYRGRRNGLVEALRLVGTTGKYVFGRLLLYRYTSTSYSTWKVRPLGLSFRPMSSFQLFHGTANTLSTYVSNSAGKAHEIQHFLQTITLSTPKARLTMNGRERSWNYSLPLFRIKPPLTRKCWNLSLP